MRILIKNFITKIFLLSLMATITTAYAAEPKWQAGWIWGADALIPNSWMAFRQQVSLDADDLKNNIINSAKNSNPILAYISADTKYWLWINGEMVVFEGSYTGGPSPVKAGPRFDNVPVATNRYYDTVDISNYLKKGENTIAALVWYYGDNGQKGTNISSGEGGFFFQDQWGKTLFVSVKNFKV